MLGPGLPIWDVCRMYVGLTCKWRGWAGRENKEEGRGWDHIRAGHVYINIYL